MSPVGEEHWAPDRIVLAHRVLTYAGRLFVERDASGVVLVSSPLSGMAVVEQRYPAWALGPFSRIEPEFALPHSPGVFALVTEGVVRYVGSSRDLDRSFGARHGLGQISRRNCQSSGQEEPCRLNRLITSEAKAGRVVDVYVLAMPKRRWPARMEESPASVAAEIVATSRGDWHPPE